MEAEIKENGKFISKGGNGMQQNLKEIVQEMHHYNLLIVDLDNSLQFLYQ